MDHFSGNPPGLPSGQSPFASLTPREREVAALITHGTPNKVIAAELGISQRTIEAHRARIFTKLRVRNAVELTRHCLYWCRAAEPLAARVAEPPLPGCAAQRVSVPGRPGPALQIIR